MTTTRWTADDVTDMTGLRAVVMGGTNGIGLATATRLEEHGATVTIGVRALRELVRWFLTHPDRLDNS